PDGRPIEGASVRISYVVMGEPRTAEIRGESGPGGRFAIRVPRAVLVPPDEGQPATGALVVATARGYCLGVVALGGPIPNLTIRLKKDDLPIEGRVIDLEGRPVAGASIRTTAVYQSYTGDLSDWLKEAQLRGSKGPWSG